MTGPERGAHSTATTPVQQARTNAERRTMNPNHNPEQPPGSFTRCQGVIEGPGEPTDCLPLCLAHERSFFTPVAHFPPSLDGLRSSDRYTRTSVARHLVNFVAPGGYADSDNDTGIPGHPGSGNARHVNTVTLSEMVRAGSLRDFRVAGTTHDCRLREAGIAIFLVEVAAGPADDGSDLTVWIVRRINFGGGQQLTWTFSEGYGARFVFAMLCGFLESDCDGGCLKAVRPR